LLYQIVFIISVKILYIVSFYLINSLLKKNNKTVDHIVLAHQAYLPSDWT